MLLISALELAARQAPGRGDDPGLGGDIIIIVAIALLFVLAAGGWFWFQNRGGA